MCPPTYPATMPQSLRMHHSTRKPRRRWPATNPTKPFAQAPVRWRTCAAGWSRSAPPKLYGRPRGLQEMNNICRAHKRFQVPGALPCFWESSSKRGPGAAWGCGAPYQSSRLNSSWSTACTPRSLHTNGNDFQYLLENRAWKKLLQQDCPGTCGLMCSEFWVKTCTCACNLLQMVQARLLVLPKITHLCERVVHTHRNCVHCGSRLLQRRIATCCHAQARTATGSARESLTLLLSEWKNKLAHSPAGSKTLIVKVLGTSWW